MPNIGPLEIAIVLVIVLIIFGPKRLPELGRSLGRGIREFRGSLSKDHKDDDEQEEKPALSSAHPTTESEQVADESDASRSNQ